MSGSNRHRISPQRAALLFICLGIVGCRSYHIETTVKNRTGAAIQLLEVDYPSASYGADALAPNADFHYRIQVQGSGPLKLQYMAAGGHQVQITGPQMAQGEQGWLQVVLLPEGKADFQMDLTKGR